MESSVIYFTSAAFWTFILLAFGMGYLIANIFTRNKFRQQLDKCHLEKSMLLNNVKEQEEEIVEVIGVKAIQTRGRSGIPVKGTSVRNQKPKKTQSKIDFERLGEGNPEQADDLQKIEGIGPFIEQQLNETGIYNYLQVSRFSDADIRIITEQLDFFPGRIVRDRWIEQAAALYHEKESVGKES